VTGNDSTAVKPSAARATHLFASGLAASVAASNNPKHRVDMRSRCRRAGWVAALACLLVMPCAFAQSTVDEIAKYRAALQDGNPAELWEARGEALWKQKRGPKQVSFEQCDLGLGAGVVKGAYARLPRYFADADRVMDLETRLVWCMVKLQGYSEADALKNPFGSGNEKKSDMEALVAYVTSE